MADDKEESSPQLSPEERIAQLEKSKKLSWILIIVLAVFSLAQTGGLAFLLLQPADNRAAENSVTLAALDAEVVELQKQQNEAERLILQNQLLETKLDEVLANANIDNYRTLRLLFIEQEKNHVQFLAALQRGMYELSRMVRGSRTWFDVYKEELDLIMEQSRHRIEELQQPNPESREPEASPPPLN